MDRLALDLSRAFPDMKGFSPRNLKYMRALAEEYPHSRFVQEVLAQMTWYHNITLLEKVKDASERQWYASQTIQHGWSRNILVHQIESGLFRRQGKAVTNFKKTLLPPQSELAQQLLKDPYAFDFLPLGAKAKERDLEDALLSHLKEFLLELGVGFAFMGRQYHLEVGRQDYYLDLLFYHLHLRCFVVLDLKIGEFQPEYAGKMNFYLSAVDDRLRQADDKPSIGMILCKEKNRVVVEYALRDAKKPIGVSTYQIDKVLPKNVRASLPSIERLEEELKGD